MVHGGSPRRSRASDAVRYFLGEKHKKRLLTAEYPVAKLAYAEKLYVNGREPQLLLLEQLDDTIETLILSNRSVSPAEGTQIVDTIRSTVTLTQLDLTSSSIRGALLYEIINALSENNSLKDLRLNYLHLGMVKHNNVSLVNTLVESIKGNTTLMRLHLERNDLGPEGLKVIARTLEENATIEDLQLARNSLSGGMTCLSEALAVNETLVKLGLAFNKLNDTDVEELCEHLPHNVALQTLELEGNAIGPGAVGRVKTLCKNSGTVVRVKNGAGALALTLEINTTLDELNLRQNKLYSSGAAILADALKVIRRPLPVGLPPQYRQEHLDIPGLGLVLAEKIRKIKTSGHVARLDIAMNNIKAAGAAAIASVITINPWLREIRLSRNDIRVAGATAFSAHLAKSSTLALLDISSNALGDSGCIAICDALKSPECGLETLFLGDNHMNRVGAEAVAEALRANSRLTNLDLHISNIRENGAVQLGAAVGSNQTLTTLNVSTCNMAEFCEELLAGIAAGKEVAGGSLTKINIADNRMTLEGVDKLTEVLVRRNIKYLDISSNGDIGRSGGMSVFAKVLGDPAVSLIDLDLRHTGVRGDVEKVLQAMKGNQKILNLKVEETDLPNHWYSEFRSLVQRNNRLVLEGLEADLKKPLVFVNTDNHPELQQDAPAETISKSRAVEFEAEEEKDDEDEEEELDYIAKIAKKEQRASVARTSRLTMLYFDDDGKELQAKLARDEQGPQTAAADSAATPKPGKRPSKRTGREDGDDSAVKKEKRKSKSSQEKAIREKA